MSFAVVTFVEDNSVDVVPRNWLADNDSTCFWPPYRAERFTTAVKKCEEPLGSWQKCSIRVLNSYGQYYCCGVGKISACSLSPKLVY